MGKEISALAENLIKACPICGMEVVNSCYHAVQGNGEDYSSKFMPVEKALQLARAYFEECRNEYEYAEANLESLKEKYASV